MSISNYLLESDEESNRLELKTDTEIVKRQALWAGIKQRMRVADIGCGIGKTTVCLHELIQPGGETVGIELSEERILYANQHYQGNGIRYVCRDIREPLQGLGYFDFVWVRFVLEYHRSKSFDIVKNLSDILMPGGILCLIDIDHNCLNHFGLSCRLERTLFGLVDHLEASVDFDPYIGRKLYSFLYDLGYEEIDVELTPHHLIFGELKDKDAYNWIKKAETVSKNADYGFKEYEGGFEEFIEEFKDFFYNPRRFTYSPLISCRGRKPYPK